MKFLFNFFFRRRSTTQVVRKTDDELTRYVKTTTLIRRRSKFETQLAEDLAAKEDRMNTAEIRNEFQQKMATIQYDKGKLNDNLSFAFLTDPKSYRPLNQRLRIYLRPVYAHDGDWQKTTSIGAYLKRLVFGLILIKVGLAFGDWDATDHKLAKQCVVNFESEDQIFDYLYNKNKRAVFLNLYTPGHMINENFMREFERESSEYSDIVFMRVLCRKHLNFCTNKMWPERILPAAEVYFIDEKDQIELVDLGDRHRSAAGIESFFVLNGLIDDKLDPSALLERAGRKYLEII